MKIVEALFSLVILSLICMTILNIYPSPQTPQIYKMQLAQDVWRIIQLKYDSIPSDPVERGLIELDLNRIKSMTGLCVYIKGVRITNCRGISSYDVVTIHRYYVNYEGPAPVLKDASITLKKEHT